MYANSTSLAFPSAWPKAVLLDEGPVDLFCFFTAAFAASRRLPAVLKVSSTLASATSMHEVVPAPQSARVARSQWAKPLSTKSVLMGAYSRSEMPTHSLSRLRACVASITGAAAR